MRTTKQHRRAVGVLLCGVWCALIGPGCAPSPGAAPLPRICARDGRFVEKRTGRTFHVRGFNYEHYKPPPMGYLGTFSPKRYCPNSAEMMLADLAEHGFTIVRVFIDPTSSHGEGIVASWDADGLSPAYIANFCDFLSRARRHRIYVLVTLDGLPDCKRYAAIKGKAPPGIEGVNRIFLHRGHIDAYALHIADFARAIRARDATLLSTVFAFQLWNEASYRAAAPFSKTSGTITPANGKTYDLSSRDDLQRMADDHAVLWANACADAVRQVDPDAMVTVGMFTFGAVGRAGPGQVRPSDAKDKRIPLRPLALTRSKLSFLDIHFYPFGPRTLDRDLRNIEFDKLKVACRKRGMPLVMGEFGAFKSAFATIPEAIDGMVRHVRRVMELGFSGYIYWTYDSHSQHWLWNAKSGRGEIFEALAKLHGGGVSRR